jgi:transposase InsO family protein
MEYCSTDFKSFCMKLDIVGHHTIPHTPQQDGVAECLNKTIISKAHYMLSNSGMSRNFWAEAASTACHLINCSPTTAMGKKTPIEVWYGSLYDYS